MDEKDVVNDEMESREDDDNWDDWEDESAPDVRCFFCEQTLCRPDLVFGHCYTDHGFDVRRYCDDNEQLTYIRLVNFIRRTKPEPSGMEPGNRPWLGSDDFLRPVDLEDPMLQFDVDDLDGIDLPLIENAGAGDPKEDAENGGVLSKLRDAERRALEAEERLDSVVEDLERLRHLAQTIMLSDRHEPSNTIQALTKDEDSAYVQPYGHYSIHQEMLQDKVRTSSYGNFITQNSRLFKDKVVLDIGCGTGILSLFAAEAGARKVFAVDHSDIYIQAKDIVHENGYDDVISVLHGKLEDVELPVDGVDIIISEWMGYFLLFESMLDTIIFAREKWLRDDGCVYPDQFTISLVASGDPSIHERNVEYWNDVYGFKMSCMRELVVREAAVDTVKREELVSEPVVIKTIDANTVSLKDVDFTAEFAMKATKKGSISAIVGYFDTIFTRNAEKEVRFSTGPDAEATHWKQTVFLVSPPLAVDRGDVVDGSIICRKNPQDPRSLKVSLTLNGETRKYVVE